MSLTVQKYRTYDKSLNFSIKAKYFVRSIHESFKRQTAYQCRLKDPMTTGQLLVPQSEKAQIVIFHKMFNLNFNHAPIKLANLGFIRIPVAVNVRSQLICEFIF